MTVITRFAPSPTGYLHIGSARTALFNYLFARHHGGKFLLRIEDTDRARSTEEAVLALINGLKWLGIDWDGDPIFQFARASRHQEVAHQLVSMGKAFYCYTSQEELVANRNNRSNLGFRSIYRNNDVDPPVGIKPVVRLKVPTEGDTIIEDLIQGTVKFNNEQLDDMVLLRADGTPTYMLAVVVDDHDMDVTHIIRGDDHLNNAGRQAHIYKAMSWNVPHFAHIPLIHGEDGAKLSKRHGALGVESYQEMGYLPEALNNYLLRLGWSHGNDEIISQSQAVEWFNLESIGRSPARLDFKKLANVNQHYLKDVDDQVLLELMVPFVALEMTLEEKSRLLKALRVIKPRSNTLIELAQNSLIFLSSFKVENTVDTKLVSPLILLLKSHEDWSEVTLQALFKEFCQEHSLKLGDVAQIFRQLLTGSNISPSIFDIMAIIGKDESLARIAQIK